MKLKPFLTILCLSALLWRSDRAVAALPDRAERPWKARWISSGTTPEQPNTWLNYRYTADLPALPSSVVARIGADSKYWLWVNGRLVVFEGGLKRGPNPQDTYYDEVELAPQPGQGEEHDRRAAVVFRQAVVLAQRQRQGRSDLRLPDGRFRHSERRDLEVRDERRLRNLRQAGPQLPPGRVEHPLRRAQKRRRMVHAFVRRPRHDPGGRQRTRQEG